MKKNVILLLMLTALWTFPPVQTAASAIPLENTTAYEAEWDETDIADAVYTDAQDPQLFVAYVYMADNEDNPYNNPYRDITVYFGGDMDLYAQAFYYNFNDDEIFEKYGVVRIVGELPKNTDHPYHIHPYASDARAMTFSYKSMYFDREVTIMDDILLADSYNEFYFVGGSKSYIDAHGSEKLTEMYDLFHSDTESINENRAAEGAPSTEIAENPADTEHVDEKQEIVSLEPRRKPTLLSLVLIILLISAAACFFGYRTYRKEKADENTYED